MPSSRSSSLSRSNIRLNASKEAGYPGTASLIWAAVRYLRADSRQTTRPSSRSVFRLDIPIPSPDRRYPAGVIRWRSGEVSALGPSWPGAQELSVTVSGRVVRALAYPELTGMPEPGDRVLLNTTALDLALGTGGYALVVAIPDRLPADPAGPGHLIKARYTPLQACVLGADEQGSEFHHMLREADDLGGMPVVVADLHSALPAILAGYLAGRTGPPPLIAYLMLDGGALPAWFSRTRAALADAGWLA